MGNEKRGPPVQTVACGLAVKLFTTFSQPGGDNMMSSTFRRGVLALGVAGTVAFGSGAAFADIGKCAAGLEKAQTGFQAALTKALVKCADGIRKDILKGAKGDVAKAAAGCNKALAGVYPASPPSLKSAVEKYRAAVDKLATGGVCADSDLISLGHQLSGSGGQATAPPASGSSIKYTEDSTLLKAESDALNSEMASTPDFFNIIQQGQLAGGCIALGYPVVTPPAAVALLCGLKQECYERNCKVDSANSGASLLSGSVTPSCGPGGVYSACLSLSGSNSFNICNVKGLLSSQREAGFLYISGNPGHGTLPISIFAGSVVVCINSVRNEGWCDCTAGAGLKLNTNLCEDRIVDTTEQAANDACGAPGVLASSDMNFIGTKNGFIKNTAGGGSTTGSCMNMMTAQFTVLQDLPADAGVDTLPCTGDDLPAPNAPAPVPLTTGSAEAHLLEAQVQGTCDASSLDCVEMADCVAGVDTTCSNTPQGTLSIGPISGAKAAGLCGAMEQGNLTGLKLVGAFPGPGKGTLGDSVTAFGITCQ
jgi:hypothetical protein